MNKEEYSLAVVIPCYNKEKYLSQCIESVLDQTYLPEEIIIIDDCSTDDSREIIRKFSSENTLILPVFLKENRGVSHARNVGLKRAESQYITFLDADDFYDNQDKLKNEMELIKSHLNDIVAYSKICYVNDDGTRSQINPPDPNRYLYGDVYIRMLTGRFDITAVARDYCVKKSIVLEAGGFNENRSLYEDLELTIKIAKRYPFYCTYNFGTAYRQVGNGLSKAKKAEHIRMRKEIFKNCIVEYNTVLRAWYSSLWYCQKFREILQEGYWKSKDFVKLIIRRNGL